MSAERLHTITRQSLRDWLRPAGADETEATEAQEPVLTGGPGELFDAVRSAPFGELMREIACVVRGQHPNRSKAARRCAETGFRTPAARLNETSTVC